LSGKELPCYFEKCITYVLLVSVLSGCESGSNPAVTDAQSSPDTHSAAPLSPRAARLFQRSCALCHVDGNAGAPRIGHPEEWSERLGQGRDKLLQHTVEGLNSMPPLGYCMACEKDDFDTLIDFLTGQNAGGLR
jgi:cytochrome c5